MDDSSHQTTEWPLPPSSPSIELSHLDSEHLQYLQRLISAILSSPAAEETFAQLIDGLITRASFLRCAESQPTLAAVAQHNAPTMEAIELFRQFRAQIQIPHIKLDSKTVQQFQNVPSSSRAFKLRLIEVAALLVHSLASSTFMSSHPQIDINPQELDIWKHWPHFLVDFYHNDYTDYSCYPRGLLDTIGYWAETQVFGGVMLFDQSTTASEQPYAYIHLPSSTARRLTESQLNYMAELGGSSSPDEGSATTMFRPLQGDLGHDEYSNLELYEKSIWRDEFSKLAAPRGTRCVRLIADSKEDQNLQSQVFALMAAMDRKDAEHGGNGTQS